MLFSDQSTSGPLRRLKNHHSLVPNEDASGLERVTKTSRPAPILQAFQNTAQQVYPSWTQDQVDDFLNTVIEWLVCTHTAIHEVDNKFFRKMITQLNPTVIPFIPKKTTFKSILMRQFAIRKEVQKTALKESPSRKTISFEVWTSPFMKKQILGLIAHYMDSEYQRGSMPLALRRL